MYNFIKKLFKKRHSSDLYNIILLLSRNIFFYEKIKLKDSFQSRIYLMLFHFSILMIVINKKKMKFEQSEYDQFFNNIEYSLREQGLGDVSVNSKMKNLNKILYDILLKIENNKEYTNSNFQLNKNLVIKYFDEFKTLNNSNFEQFQSYFNVFFNFCFELNPKNMLKDIKNFKF